MKAGLVQCLKVTVIFLLLSISVSSAAQEKDFNRLLASEDLYNTCKKILFTQNRRTQIIYEIGTSPEIVCRCSGEFVAKSMTWDEFNYIKTQNNYPDSILERIVSTTNSCATITAK